MERNWRGGFEIPLMLLWSVAWRVWPALDPIHVPTVVFGDIAEGLCSAARPPWAHPGPWCSADQKARLKREGWRDGSKRKAWMKSKWIGVRVKGESGEKCYILKTDLIHVKMLGQNVRTRGHTHTHTLCEEHWGWRRSHQVFWKSFILHSSVSDIIFSGTSVTPYCDTELTHSKPVINLMESVFRRISLRHLGTVVIVGKNGHLRNA